MKIRTSATVPAVGSFSRHAAHHWNSRRHLDRPFSQDRCTGHLAHIAEVLPAVLRNLTTSAKGVAQ